MRPRAWIAEPAALVRRSRGLVITAVTLVLLVAVGGGWVASASGESPKSVAAAAAGRPPSTPTPTSIDAAGPARVCWDGSRISSARTCPVPRGVRGLALASPAFAAALQAGRCRPLPTALEASGFICSVRGAQLRFAWFRTPAQLDARFERSFGTCRTVSYLRVCRGPGGSAIRYADPGFVLEVAAQPAARDVLLGLPFNPSIPMVRGTT